MPAIKPFTLLIKPASADCNLRCEYCFYLDKCRLYPESGVHRMTDEVLEELIRGYMATKQPVYAFGWQGGEPTLMGIDFFRKLTQFQETYGRPGVRVANGLQTNATLITQKLAEHFGKYRFLLGCSLDGPVEMHDRYRRAIGEKATHAKVIEGLEILKRHQVEFNILTLVSQANVHYPLEVYRYLVSHGFLYHQYIPCVEFNEQGQVLPFSINGQEWGTFLCEIFDEWYRRDRYRVSIRYFDSVLFKMIEGTSNVCHMDRNCCQYFVVEHNGDIYPCDFFVESELKLGNVMEDSWSEILKSKTYKQFGAQKARWNQVCQKCVCLELCSGDCLKHRLYNGNSPQNLSYLCSGWKQFLRYTKARFESLAEEIKERRIKEERRVNINKKRSTSKEVKIGRNDPCPCGSGRKYKKCCGA